MLGRLTLLFLRLFSYVRELECSRQQCAEYLAGKMTIEEIAIENGAITIHAGTEMCRILGSQFLAVLDGGNAENYVEMEMTACDGRRVAVTIQRCEKKRRESWRSVSD